MATAQEINEEINRISTMSDRDIKPGLVKIWLEERPIAKTFLDQSVDEMFGGARLRARGKRTQAGGRQVQIQHVVEENSTFKWMAGPWDTFDTTPQDPNRRSLANWKHASATSTISKAEELYNQGESVLVDLVTAETEHAISTMVTKVSDAIADGTSNPSDAITALNTLISANDTVQGLPGGSHTKWNSRGISSRGTAPASVSFASGGFSAQGVSDMRKAWQNASEGSKTPNVIFTTHDIFNFYEGTLVPQERYAGGAVSTGDASFIGLAFKNAPVFADPGVASGEMLFVNTEEVYVMVLAGADMTFGEWILAQQQEARTRELMFKAQLVVRDRRFINKLTGITQ